MNQLTQLNSTKTGALGVGTSQGIKNVQSKANRCRDLQSSMYCTIGWIMFKVVITISVPVIAPVADAIAALRNTAY